MGSLEEVRWQARVQQQLGLRLEQVQQQAHALASSRVSEAEGVSALAGRSRRASEPFRRDSYSRRGLFGVGRDRCALGRGWGWPGWAWRAGGRRRRSANQHTMKQGVGGRLEGAAPAGGHQLLRAVVLPPVLLVDALAPRAHAVRAGLAARALAAPPQHDAPRHVPPQGGGGGIVCTAATACGGGGRLSEAAAEGRMRWRGPCAGIGAGAGRCVGVGSTPCQLVEAQTAPTMPTTAREESKDEGVQGREGR